MDGVPPEGFKDLDCLPTCFDFGYHLALVSPPLVLDDEELEVSITTKINNLNNSQILLYLIWNGVKSITIQITAKHSLVVMICLFWNGVKSMTWT